jgi:hypothetical protein
VGGGVARRLAGHAGLDFEARLVYDKKGVPGLMSGIKDVHLIGREVASGGYEIEPGGDHLQLPMGQGELC